MSRIIAIIVTYHPRAAEFLPLFERLAAQTDRVIVVDNTPGADDAEAAALLAGAAGRTDSLLIRLGENTGIARAINEGCKHAMASGADFVLLSDQDSLPAGDMVHELHRAYRALAAAGVPVGAVGPTYSDLRTGLTYPFQAQLPGRLFYGHRRPSRDCPHVEALTLISSGLLIPVEVIGKVGPMREDFFIDQVDIEWCHRARAMGYRLFGTGWATMHQRMGEAPLRVWCLRWWPESAYSPTRIYYRIRNFTAMLRLGFIDWRWKIRSSWYHLGLLYSHVLFGPHPLESMKMFFLGVWHGLRGRMGAFEGKK